MEYFIVEGTILDAKKMTDKLMEIHKVYTQKAMDSGLILMSGLKNDMSGGIFMLKASSEEEVQTYLDNEPFKLEGIQEYKILKFSPHYFNKNICD
ncbi:MAG: YciI family protein [Clostridium sp.]